MFEIRLGDHGELQLRGRLDAIHKEFEEERKNGLHAYREVPNDEIARVEVREYSDWARNRFLDFVVVGIGGSSLGPAALLNAFAHPFNNLLTPMLMLRGLRLTLREHGVTLQTVFGAVAIYLLIGVFCASVYGSIARYGGQPLFAGGAGDGTLSEHYYFSFITQATVGYGDFAPGSSLGRSVAVFQALVGQLYLVTVLALLVSNLGRGPGRGLRRE